MRVILHSGGTSWDLDWGVHLIGTDPECDVRLPAQPGVPAIAGVLVRWMEHVALLGVGSPPGLALDGEPVFHKEIELRTLPACDLFADGAFARGRHVTAGTARLILSVEDVPNARRAQEFAVADLEAVLEHAMTHGLKGTGGTLGKLVASMTGATAVPAPPVRAARPAADSPLQTLKVHSRTAAFPDCMVTLQFGGAPPDTFDAERVAEGVAHTLESTAAAVADGRVARGDLAAYGGGTVHLPQMAHRIGAYTVLGPDDFDHLGLPHGRVRTPQTLVSTIHGRTEIVDLAEPSELLVNGNSVRRARLDDGGAMRVLGKPMSIEPHAERSPELSIPGNVFRHLGLWADPVTQMARLGLLLPHLSSRFEQRVACLVAAVSGVRGAALVCASAPRNGRRRFTPLTTRWLASSLELERFQSFALLDDVLARAEANGTFVSGDALADPRLTEAGRTPADRAVPFWGAVAGIAQPDQEALLVWRSPGDGAFHPAEVSFLEAVLSGMRSNGLLMWSDLADPHQSRRKPKAPAPVEGAPAFLSVGRFELPLGEVTLLGRDATAEIKLLCDPSMSPRQALIVREAAGYRVFDTRSFHGTTLDGKRVSEAPLLPGQELRLGSTKVHFQLSKDIDQMLEEPTPHVPEDLELSPDPDAVLRAHAVIELGRRLAGETLEEQARAVAEAAVELLHCAAHVVHLREGGTLCVLASAPEPPKQALLKNARTLLGSALWTGQPQGTGALAVLAVPAPVLTTGQDDQAAVLLHRHGGWKPEVMASAHAFAGLLGVPRAERVAALKLEDRVVPVRGPVWLGRSPECHLVLDQARVSRKHALVMPGIGSPPFLWLVDMLSDTGTTVLGKPIERAKLRDGDTFQIDRFTITVEVPKAPAYKPTDSELARVLGRSPSLLALGRELAVPTPEVYQSLSAHLRTALGAERVVVLGRRTEILGASSTEDRELGRSAASLVENFEVSELVRGVRSTHRAMLRTLEPERIYRKAPMASIMCVPPLSEKSALAYPFAANDDDPRVIVVGSTRATAIAFAPLDLALIAAVAESCRHLPH